ncbi:MAG TPA: sodium:proton antiporter, partial [Bacteroidota bacterium]|nr:sodium:proton antiporter [Bacteroidota bacterium]
MRKSKKHILLYFTFASIAALIVYNIFGFAIHSSEVISVNPIFILPFALLLLSIAVMPFLNRAWWDRYYPYVALAFGSIVIVYYFFGLQHADRIVATSYDYICFMSLIGSLYIVSSGIHINFRGKTTPAGNVALLTTGSVLSNFIGTTGASMLLIRPFLRMNRYRIKPYHIVFFIFLVSNIGGAMTPIGNPPLFFGYLKGIPFFWMADHSASLWLLSMGILLTIFFVIDRIAFHKESKTVRSEAAMIDDSEVHGLHNIIFLLIIVGAVFIDSPAPLLLREVIMWGAALASYFTTKPEAHQKNNFNFIPLKEVAILFAGIFAAMMPALDWLETHAAGMGIVTPGQYYWYSGTLSSILDNAPTYLNFLTAAFGLHGANV